MFGIAKANAPPEGPEGLHLPPHTCVFPECGKLMALLGQSVIEEAAAVGAAVFVGPAVAAGAPDPAGACPPVVPPADCPPVPPVYVAGPLGLYVHPGGRT